MLKCSKATIHIKIAKSAQTVTFYMKSVQPTQNEYQKMTLRKKTMKIMNGDNCPRPAPHLYASHFLCVLCAPLFEIPIGTQKALEKKQNYQQKKLKTVLTKFKNHLKNN